MRAMDLSPASRAPMGLPAPRRLIVLSLALALVLNLLPWQGTALLARPDFLLLMLLYWGVHEPRAVGQGWAFTFGLVMDVAGSMLLGQHALVYVVAMFLVQLLRLRMLQLSVIEQALHIIAILFVAQGIGVLLNTVLGRPFPGAMLALSPLFAAILWPFVNYLATRPRFRRRTSAVVI
jgi:rod shape-determining protein MreD